LAAHVAPAASPEGGLQDVAIDGKAQRGRLRFGADGCPMHALSACCHASGLVLAHEPITGDDGKAEAGVSPFQLQQWLGHSLLDTTTIYVHLARKNAKRVMEATSL